MGQRLRPDFSILFAIALALALSACGPPRPLSPGTDTTFYGYISEGAKFGVTIGDSRETARMVLEREGFSDSGATDCGDSALQFELGCGRGDIFDIYHRHRGLGHDAVSLQVKNEHITMIAWESVIVQIDS